MLWMGREGIWLFGDGMSKKEKQNEHWKYKAFIFSRCFTDTYERVPSI